MTLTNRELTRQEIHTTASSQLKWMATYVGAINFRVDAPGCRIFITDQALDYDWEMCASKACEILKRGVRGTFNITLNGSTIVSRYDFE